MLLRMDLGLLPTLLLGWLRRQLVLVLVLVPWSLCSMLQRGAPPAA